MKGTHQLLRLSFAISISAPCWIFLHHCIVCQRGTVSRAYSDVLFQLPVLMFYCPVGIRRILLSCHWCKRLFVVGMLSRHTMRIFKLDASLPFYTNTLVFYLSQQTTYPIFLDFRAFGGFFRSGSKTDECFENDKIQSEGKEAMSRSSFWHIWIKVSRVESKDVARMGEERGVYRVLLGKQEGRRPLGRTRRRWVDNIRMDLQEVGCGYMDWIGLAQDRGRYGRGEGGI